MSFCSYIKEKNVIYLFWEKIGFYRFYRKVMIIMFEVGKTVSYGPQGVFRIAEIADKNLTGKKQKYYILRSVKGNGSLVYVPVDNEKLVGKMRPLMSTEQVIALIDEMPLEECTWIENDDERKDTFRKIIAESDPQKLAYLIRSVYLHKLELDGNSKKLHISDERFFKEAERILYDEFSMALDISSDDVPSFIVAKIGQ